MRILQNFMVGGAALFLGLLAFIEVIFGMPNPGLLYVIVAAVMALGLLRWRPIRAQSSRIIVLASAGAIIATLYFVPWSSRKPFLNDLDRIKPGMSEADVRRIMERYEEGTGWPAMYGGSPEGTGTLNDSGTGASHRTGSTPSGEMVLEGALVFRHSKSGRFDSDWGIVSLRHGKVTKVSFSPD